MAKEEYVEYEEVETEVEEVPQPHVIETGDSVKVKQVLDDATMEAVKNYGYDPNYWSEDIKLALMFFSCVLSWSSNSFMAASNCSSMPAYSFAGSLSTTTSGSTP